MAMQDTMGHMDLMWAAQCDHDIWVDVLLEAEADVSTFKCVSQLIKAGTDV